MDVLRIFSLLTVPFQATTPPQKKDTLLEFGKIGLTEKRNSDRILNSVCVCVCV